MLQLSKSKKTKERKAVQFSTNITNVYQIHFETTIDNNFGFLFWVFNLHVCVNLSFKEKIYMYVSRI